MTSSTIVSPVRAQLYQLLLAIPAGKVSTYGALSHALHSSPRAVASMLAANQHPDVVACYKVIHSDGRVGGYSATGGALEKIARLQADGIVIVQGRIDLHQFGYLHF